MLKCISKYKSSLGAFEPGDVITDAVLVAALLADSPLSFEPQGATDSDPAVVALQEPDEHRAIKRRGKV